MIHFDGHEYAGWAFIVLIGAACFLCLVVADHPGIARRLRQAGDLLASAGPWFVSACLTWACRGRSPSQAHPAAKAVTVRGWENISASEEREFGLIAEMLRAGVETPEPQTRAPRRES